MTVNNFRMLQHPHRSTRMTISAPYVARAILMVCRTVYLACACARSNPELSTAIEMS